MGCDGGCGVGLDSDNRVNLLKPGSPAAKVLLMGDKVTHWNNIEMVEERDGQMQQRLLKDVVTPAYSHTLVVQRVCNALQADSPERMLDVEWESGLTCVEYLDEARNELRLGVYIAYSILNSEPHIRPLCAASEDEGVSSLLCDEDAPPAPLSSVHRILDPDYVYVSERQAGGGQGLGNPHGEHGEECYDLRDVDVSTDVRVVIREGRDTERVL
eukprot:CAMPEP_0119311942 /NCGR_PEP_ID=MMETSP1333-20130426/24505_1 /TAXON_ID=418940 /ORGANISM="Scyphosphaera apsteinii, Strain RCC1455" /LENGTH=213 /DNA_ID=CAMNT_0007316457 /DNA_START=204 /DNA_END=845 /DNA_ORIENTATION=+